MQTHLTRIPHPQGRNTNPHTIHRWLDYVFDCGNHVDGRPYTFAIVEQERALYVRSQTQVRWQESNAMTQFEPYVPVLGAVHTIEVILNPVSRHGSQEKNLTRQADVVAFAVNLLQQNGFAVATVLNDQFEEAPQIQVTPLCGLPVQAPNKPRPIPLQLWRCRAQVIVSDADLAEQAMVHGIGRSKRYGAGLILIRG